MALAKKMVFGVMTFMVLGATAYLVAIWKTPDETPHVLAFSRGHETVASNAGGETTGATSGDISQVVSPLQLPSVTTGITEEHDPDFFEWLTKMVSSVSFEMVQQVFLSDQPSHRKDAVIETYIEVFGADGIRRDMAKWKRLLEHLLARPELISPDSRVELSMVLGLIARENPETRERYTQAFVDGLNDESKSARTIILASGVWDREILENAASDDSLGYGIRSASVRAITHCDQATTSFLTLIRNPGLGQLLQEDIARFAPRAAKDLNEINAVISAFSEIPDERRRKNLMDMMITNVSTSQIPEKTLFYLDMFRHDLERARTSGDCPEDHFSAFVAYHAYFLEKNETAKNRYRKEVLSLFEEWMPKYGTQEMPKCFWESLASYAESFEGQCKFSYQYNKEPNAFEKYCVEPQFERRVKALREKYVKNRN